MAFFKFRFPGQDDQAHHNNDSPHESLEALRKRVKHRLIGSGVLVLIAVIGFPLVFDTQPRPVGLDIPIDIPDKAKTAANVAPTPLKSDKRAILVDKNQDQGNDSSSSQNPSKGADLAKSSQDNVVAGSSSNASGSAGATPLAPSPSALATPTPVTAPAQTSTPSALTASGSSKSSANSPANASSASSRSSESKSAPVNTRATLDAKEEIVPPSKTQSSNSKTTSSETTSTQKDDRFVIQVGAYSDEQKVKEIREKLEKAGLHTYTQVVEKDGKKIRIRIGPFTSKEDANRQLQKVKSLNLQPNLLTL